MAAAYVTSEKGRTILGLTANTNPIDTNTGNALFIGTALFITTSTFVSVTDNDGGSAPTQDHSQSYTGVNNCRAFSKLNLSAKTGYVATLTWTTSGYGAITVVEASGVATSSALDQHVDGGTAGSLSATTGTLAQADEFAMVYGAQSGAVAWSCAAGGFTERQNTREGTPAEDACCGTQVTAATTALTGTLSAGTNPVVIVATYLAAAAGASGNPWYTYAQMQ